MKKQDYILLLLYVPEYLISKWKIISSFLTDIVTILNDYFGYIFTLNVNTRFLKVCKKRTKRFRRRAN